MANPLAQAQKSGVRMNGKIAGLFANIGNKDHPRGIVTAAYRNARRAMEIALQEGNRASASNEVLASLRTELNSGLLTLFRDAQELGAEESARQLRFYGIDSGTTGLASVGLTSELQSVVGAVMSNLDTQEKAIRALVLTEADSEQILGSEERVGVMSAGTLVSAATVWATTALWDAFDYWTSTYAGGMNFQKQAVAALDSKTTDCCLRVHGQIQPMNTPFLLTGTPRFADKMDWPAFHWWCRTSGVLYLAEFDFGLTAQMQAGSSWFLNERAAGRNPNQNPANALRE